MLGAVSVSVSAASNVSTFFRAVGSSRDWAISAITSCPSSPQAQTGPDQRTLNATAANRYGGAFGVEHIFFPTLSPADVERHWRNLVDIVHKQNAELLGPPGEQVGLQVGQLVLESAVVKVMDDTGPNRDTTLGDEFGVGARFQYTLSNAWIFRADVMHDWRDFARDSSGARMEVRMKF